MWTCHFTHATKANEVGVVLAKGVNKGVPQQQQQQEYQLFVQLQVWNKRTDMWQSFLNGILLVKGNLIEGLLAARRCLLCFHFVIKLKIGPPVGGRGKNVCTPNLSFHLQRATHKNATAFGQH